MRKYLLFIFTFLLLTGVFSFSAIQRASAADGTAGIGDACATDGATNNFFSPNPLSRVCKPGLHCQSGTSFGGFGSTCVKDDPITCHCQNADVNSPDGTGKNQIVCDGVQGAPIYCADNTTCTKAADNTASANNQVDFKKQDDGVYKNKSVTGVSCTENKKVAKCKCNGPNTFQCDVDGKQNAGGGSCKADGAQCSDADPNASIDTQNTDSYTGDLTSLHFDIKGITCAPPKAQCTCEHPGVAADGQNGFNCTQTVNGQTQTVHDFCAHENMACNTASGSAMLKGDGSKTQPFSGADLQGIKCSNPTADALSPAPTEPPPPSPPCKTWGGDGQCTSFGTAFGDLATDPAGFVKTIFAVLLSFSGGIALLLIIRAGYALLTSQGKPEQINQARDQLIAAIVGLVFLIFAFVVLETIGVDILHLPGFAPSA